jgi:cytochrome P450
VSVLASQEILRPRQRGFKAWLMAQAMTAVPFLFAVLRRCWPIAHAGSIYVVTRHDDVREVFGTDIAFQVPYKANLDVITGEEPFFLGMSDTPAYHASVNAMRKVICKDDLPELGRRAEEMAEAIVARCGGRLEVVDGLVRRVTFDLLTEYFGVPAPASGRLDVWATRLFEFQFVGSPKDIDLRAQVDEIAPAFRAHIDQEIVRRKATRADGDDVLARCLAQQARGVPGFSDVEIRSAVLCMIVGGPPQPPMVVPQAMEQLLRRPTALAAASTAARADDDAALAAIVLEAMRFDPLAPGLPRVATQDWIVAKGTGRERKIPKGATVLAAFASAMMDPRRVGTPAKFDPNRRAYEYFHFGYGLHTCFGRHINGATLHRMLKPLLKHPNLRRAAGPVGRLSKNGPFAERLIVEFD